jgi:hypothetical protein
VRDEVVERLVEQPVPEGVRVLPFPQLQEQALAQVASGHARRVEGLQHLQHLLGLRHRERRRQFPIGRFRREGRLKVGEAPQHFLERRHEVAVVADVAEELLGHQQLPRRQAEQLELVPQVRGEVGRLHPHRLDELALLALLLPAALVEPRQEDLVPVGRLRVRGLRGLLLLRGRRRELFLFLGLEHLEEGIVQQLLLEMLLEVQQRHIQQVHRLVEPRVDPQILAEHRVLAKHLSHAAGASRARRRAVSVGPR